MKKLICLFLVLLLSGGIVGVCLYWRSDRRRVGKLLTEAVELACKAPRAAPHDGILKYAAVDRIFAEPLTIYSERPHFRRELSRSESRTMLAYVHRQVRQLAMETGNMRIRIHGEAADFSFDAEISAEFRGDAISTEVVTVHGNAVKQDGRWLISAVTLTPVVRLAPFYEEKK